MIARSFLLVLGVSIGAAGMYYYEFNQWQRDIEQLKREHQAQVQSTLLQEQITNQALKNQLDQMQAKSMLDQATISRFTEQTARLQEELSERNEELLFYEEMLPAGPSGSISLRGLEINREGRRIQFKVVLSRNLSEDKPFKGRLQFQAKGIADGKEVSINLLPEQLTADNRLAEPPAAGTKGNNLKNMRANPILDLEFSRIQRSQGLLVLPEGFEPFEVTLRVLEGNNVRITKAVIL